MLHLSLFVSTFALIFVAELPDKTALATVLLAIRYRPLAVFVGVAGAFVVQSAVAVTFGSALGLLPGNVVRIAAGLLFLVLAVLMWARRPPDQRTSVDGEIERERFWSTVSTSFVVIFLAEWGDLTQLATAGLAAKYPRPLTIFAAATLALWCVTAIGIAIGNQSKRVVNVQFLQRTAAVVFGAVGVLLLIRA